MSKRTRSKKRSQGEEERRRRLLQHILNKWLYVKCDYGDDESYLFVYHRATDDNSTSKIEQLILSGDEIQDGVYLITDYEIVKTYNYEQKEYLIELILKRYDKKTGFDADEKEELTESFEELKDKLVGAKYLTEEEFFLYCQSKQKPPGISEMYMSYDE